MENSPHTHLDLMKDCVVDLRRTVRQSRETLDGAREAMAEADKIISGGKPRKAEPPDQS